MLPQSAMRQRSAKNTSRIRNCVDKGKSVREYGIIKADVNNLNSDLTNCYLIMKGHAEELIAA